MEENQNIYQEKPIYELENYRTKLIEHIDRLIYHLVNKERTSGEDISLQHLRILREMPQIEEIEFDNSRGSNVQKTQYSLITEEHLKSFLDSTKNYNKKDNNHDWKTDKKLNPNYKENWCKFGKRCRNKKHCWFRHPEDVGLKETPSQDKWCQSCLSSKGKCDCLHLFVGLYHSSKGAAVKVPSPLTFPNRDPNPNQIPPSGTETCPVLENLFRVD